MSANLPKELNLASNKPMSANGKPYINRFRSDNSTYTGGSGSGDVIRIEIPTGRQGSYLFPKDSFLEAKVSLTVVDSTASKDYYIDQCIYSLFNRIRVFHGSTVLEDTAYVSKIWNALYDIQINENERRGDCLTKLIGDTSTSAAPYLQYNDACTGLKIMTSSATTSQASTSSVYDFTFVLPSALLGSLCSKALPLGLMGASSLYLELELSSAPMAFVTASTTTTSASSYFTVSDIYYNAKMTTLPSEIHELLIESTGGYINIPAVAYKSEVKSISSGTTAFNDKFSFQFSSIKNFLFFLQNGATAIGSYSKRSTTSRPKCNLQDYFLLINGEAYPSQTIANPSRMYMELCRSFDGMTDTNFGGIITYQNYIYNTHDDATDVLTATASQSINKRFIAGIDTDRFSHSSDTLMSGTSSIGQMVSLQLNFSSATTNALNLYSVVQYDVLYHIQDGQVSAKF